MTPWRRRLRRIRRWLWAGLALTVIVLGLCVGLLSRLLPMLESRPQQVADWLQQRLGVAVELQAVSGEWNGRGILLDLQGLRLGTADGLSIERAVLQIDVFFGLLPGTPLTSLKLDAPQVEAIRDREGRWQLRGLGVARPDQTIDLRLLERLGELVLDGATLRLRDADGSLDWRLERVDARLRTQGGRLRAGLMAYQRGGAPLRLTVDIDSASQSGRAYLELRDGALDPWLETWLPPDWVLPKARLGLRAWAHLSEGRIEQVNFETELSGEAATAPGAVLSASDRDGGLPPLTMRGRWQGDAQAWSFKLEQRAAAGWLSLSQDGGRRSLQAADWTLQDLLPWALHSPGLSLEQRAQWRARQPVGTIEALRWDRPQNQPQRWLLRLRGLGLAALGSQPGVSDLDLSLDGVGERFAIDLHGAPIRFDWPSSLREVMRPELDAALLLWRDDDPARSWCLSVRELRVEAADYRIDAVGDVCFNGARPQVEVQAQIARTDITVAKKFWIINKMPPAAVRWLDAALEAGQLARGRVLLSGDLDDWPFREQQGRFEAIADLEAVRLAYRPDWPAGEQLSGEARFINDAMEVDLSARIGEIAVSEVRGGIAHFRDALLSLQIAGQADGMAMLAFLRASPLWSRLQAGLDSVRIRGPGQLQLDLEVPLKPDSPGPTLHGSVTLEQADLRHSGWGIAFDAAQGRVDFTERGVQVEALEVLHMGRPARFSLAVGSFAEDPSHLVEAHLNGRLDATALIDTQPELNWLKPFVLGASSWNIDLAVPQLGGKVPTLRLRSDLLGTELTLPAPLRKTTGVAMPLDLRLDLAEREKAIDLQLGELLRLRGVIAADQPFSGLAEFGESHSVERPARGIAVVGQVPVLDTSGWLGLAVGGEGGLLASIDLQCGELDVLGRPFAETRMIYSTEGEDKRIVLLGSAVAGEIEIPGLNTLLQRGITARLERLYWPSSDEDDNATAGMDPRSVPPLHIHARDLHLGNAVLGDTRLESFPTRNGMRIEQFSAESEALSLDARGDWLREPTADRSQFEVEFTAQDLGGMLQALGFAEFVDGGQTLATLKAEWPGAPATFGLQKASGELVISVGKGRIPDVDPGAGRLFGLLSLAEIPRRLALDFSDFFRSGLAFNKIEGRFRLTEGVADAELLLIDSPAAEIRLRGLTDLRQQTYDQTMEVLPRAGSVLPVVGALAGGPAGAALGAVAQAVLQKPFKQMTRALYRVSGAWDKPLIELIERGPGKATAAPAVPEAEADDSPATPTPSTPTEPPPDGASDADPPTSPATAADAAGRPVATDPAAVDPNP